jgi:hypothetical protein
MEYINFPGGTAQNTNKKCGNSRKGDAATQTLRKDRRDVLGCSNN